jgi:hypothetical protein
MAIARTAQSKMAKGKKPNAHQPIGGPHLSAALFCDQILEEKEGTLSAIRIVDTLTLRIPQSTPTGQKVPVEVWMLLMVKSGDSPGKHEVRVDMLSPTGRLNRGKPQVYDLSEQPYGGINLRLMVTIAVKKGGVFWAKTYLDGKLIANTPLYIIVERIPDEVQPSPSTNGEKAPKTKKARKSSPGDGGQRP